MKSPLPFHKLESGFQTLIQSTLARLAAACSDPQDKAESSGDATIIEECRRSPARFRRHLLIDVHGEAVRFGSHLDDWQREDFESLDEAWMYAAKLSNRRPVKRRGYLERPRGHSKTTDIAVMTMWAIMAAPLRISGYVAAASEDQAELLVQAADRVLQLNPWLEEIIEIQKGKITNYETGSVAKIVAAKSGTIYGQTPDFIVADELTHWTDKRVWTAIYSGIPKVPTSVAVVISNAGYGRGRSWQWKLREQFRQDPAWHFRSLPCPVASWLSSEDIEEQRRNLDDDEYRRLWLNKWLSDNKVGIPHNQVIDCTILEGPWKGTADGYDAIIGGLDVGITHDRTSLVWLGVDAVNQRLRLLKHHTWSPGQFENGKVDLGVVEDQIERDYRQFGRVDCLYADDWQAVRTLQILGRQFRCEEVAFGSTAVKRDMGKLVVDAFRTGWINLFYDEVLERDILALEVRRNDESRSLSLSAVRDETGHADSAFALAIGIMKGWSWLQELSLPVDSGETDTETILPS